MNQHIFRVQNDDGRGPYRPGISKHWVDANHDSRNHVVPTQTLQLLIGGMMARRIVFGFGFRTLLQLRIWFSVPEREKLSFMGYRVVTMDVLEILHDDGKQILFRRTKPLNQDAVLVPWSGV